MKTKEEILEIIERNAEMIAFPEEATDTLTCVLYHIAEREEELDLFTSLIEEYTLDAKADLNKTYSQLKEIGERLAIHEYSMYMVFFLAVSDAMRDRYDEAGIDRRIFVETLGDLKNHLLMCLDLYGIWGHAFPTWQSGFLKLKTFSFGRLQFQDHYINIDCEVDGISIKSGARTLFVHIPRTGGSLDHDMVVSSYKAATEFFAPKFGDEPIIFACNSWLLYPRNLDFLSEKSNIRAFCNDFKIVQVVDYPDYTDTWRLFDKIYTGDPDDMPADTTLRRAYIELMKRGEKTGRALGVFIGKQS